MSFLSNHWPTVVLALAALVIWTIGNRLQKKILVIIGIVLCVVALLTYTNIFNFLFQL